MLESSFHPLYKNNIIKISLYVEVIKNMKQKKKNRKKVLQKYVRQLVNENVTFLNFVLLMIFVKLKFFFSFAINIYLYN